MIDGVNVNRGLFLADSMIPDDTPPWLYRMISSPDTLDLKNRFDKINKAKEQAKIAHLPTRGKENVELKNEAKNILNWPSEKRRKYYVDLEKKKGRKAAIELVNEVTRQRGIQERKQGKER